MIKFTVVTCTYNAESVLQRTLDSVNKQTYCNIEHLIIDGVSKDKTLAMVRAYQNRAKAGENAHEIVVYSESDKGLYDAMNKGIRMATGEVIGILTSDDFYTSDDALACIAWTLEKEKVDAVYGDIHYVNDDDLTKCVRYYSSKPFRKWMMRLGFMPAHPSFYCRKEVYEKFGAFDAENYRVAADFENLLRLIFVNKIKTHYISKDFVTMRTGGASSSGLESHKRIMRDHLKAFKKNGVYSNIFLLGLRYLYKIGEILKSKC